MLCYGRELMEDVNAGKCGISGWLNSHRSKKIYLSSDRQTGYLRTKRKQKDLSVIKQILYTII